MHVEILRLDDTLARYIDYMEIHWQDTKSTKWRYFHSVLEPATSKQRIQIDLFVGPSAKVDPMTQNGRPAP